MKVSRTLLSLLLILILSFSILAACASEPAGTSSTPADISGTESAAEGFPLEEKNFGGKEITILCVDRHTYGVMQFAPDSEINANAVNDAVAERNNFIEEKYGLTIKTVGEDFPVETLRLAVTSGIDDYDMICDTILALMPLIPENLYLELDDYIDITNEWWDQNANELLTFNDKHYLVSGDAIITDDDYQVVGRKITVYNQNLDLIEDSIIHDITQGKITRQILYSDGYLYFYTNDTITDSNDIYKINLSDYHEECVFAEPDTNEINMYLDIVKIYGSKNPDDYDIRGMSKYGDELYILTNSNKIFAVNVITGIRRLVLEEQYIHCFCMSNNGAIFYINADGNPVCFDNEKKIVSDRVFNNVCADGEYVYCTNKKVTYRYKVSDFSEEKYADVGEIYQVENGKALSSNGIYISEYGKQTKISEEGNLFLLDGKIVRQNGELLSFVEVQLF